MKQVAFLSLVLILFSDIALADNKIRIVCHRLSDQDLRIKGVIVIEQDNTDVYRGDQLTYSNISELPRPEKIPFTIKVYRTEMMPDYVSRQTVKDYSDQLLAQDEKKPVVINAMGTRNYGNFGFERVSTDPNVDGDKVFFLPSVSPLGTYSTPYDFGGFRCFNPFTVEENPTPQAE